MQALPSTTRYSFLAHEPAAGRRDAAAPVAAGGAGYAVAEQAAAVRRFLATRGTAGSCAEVAVVAPGTRPGSGVGRGAPRVSFPAPTGSLDTIAARLIDDPVALGRFARVLGDAPVLAHHLPAARVVEALGLPTLCALHSLWPSVKAALTGEPEGVRGQACASLLERAAAILVATGAERDELIRTAPPAALARGLARRVHVVRHGVDPYLERLAARDGTARRRLAWRRRLLPAALPDDVVLYAVGRLVPYKRPLEVIEAFVRVADRIPRAHLLVVGPPTDPAYATRCAEAIRAAPAAVARRIALVGPQRLEAAPLAGDVLVHISRFESWGRTIDEALVLARPALLQASPFVAERVDCPWPLRPGSGPIGGTRSDRALWIDASDPDALDAALVRAVGDASWRAACGAFHRACAARLGWEGPVMALLAVWNDVEHAHRGTRPFSWTESPPDSGAPRCASS